MKRRYNKEQKAYIEATAAYQAVSEAEKKAEAEFVKSLGITNEDGSIPTRTYAIDDDEIAEKAMDDFGKWEVESGLWARILRAREEKNAAEEDLIKYALSIIPFPKERKILEEAARVNYKVRTQMIETVMKLDAATVRI